MYHIGKPIMPLALAAALLILVAGKQPSALAATTPPSSGAAVSPTTTALRLKAGQNSAAYTSTVRNTTAAPLHIHVSCKDFVAGADARSGAISILESGMSTSISNRHSLATHVTVSTPDFVVLPQQTQSVTVQLSNTDRLTQGGHYAAVLFEIQPVRVSASKGTNVSLRQTIASLLFISTEGSGNYAVRTKTSLPTIAWLELPKSYDIAIANTGSIQTIPRGYIRFAGPFGRQLPKAIINSDSGLVLPGSTRLFRVATAGYRLLLPGIYSVDSYFRPDTAHTFAIEHHRIVYIGWPAMVFVAVITLLWLQLSRLGKRLRHKAKLTLRRNMSKSSY